MKLIEINRNPSTRQLRTFGAIWFPLFCGMIGLAAWRATYSDLAWIIAGSIAGLSVLLALGIPKALKPLFIGLMIVSFPIGWVVSHVLIALVYYVVITPLGLLLRLFGKDPMSRRMDPGASTYWVSLREPASKSNYFRQY
ncbi:MAG: hypothetical protein H6839_06455 [Planctomycetes bacterium]|nr:hypothetical protein [Planctomycetota bacterium]